MYRILEEHGEVRERRNQRRHPNYTKAAGRSAQPGLVVGYYEASWPRQVDLLLPLRHPDIFSRYVVGWMLAHRESAALAQRLIAESCRKQDIAQLTLHADRGSSMRSKPVALLLADLGVTKTHSRPYVSNDNPYSESQFKTMKYCPQFPSRSAEDGRLFSVSTTTTTSTHRNRLHDAGRRSLWSRRTAHHRSAPDPSRSSSDSSRTLRSRNATTSRFASSGFPTPHLAAASIVPPFSPRSRSTDVDRTGATSLPTAPPVQTWSGVFHI